MASAPIKKLGIVGAGIGGLALAQLLRIRAPHIAVRILERDISLHARSQGYVLGLIPSAMSLLDPVIQAGNTDLGAMLKDERNALHRFMMADGNAKLLLSAPAGGGVYVDRVRFRKALAQDLDIQWGKVVHKYDESPESVKISFSDGTEEEVDMLIGCDGANSKLRKQFAPGIMFDELPLMNTTGVLPASCLPPRLYELASQGLARFLAPAGHTMLLIRFYEESGKEIALWVLSHPGRQDEWQRRFTSVGDRTDEEFSESHFGREDLKGFVSAKTEQYFHPMFNDMISRTSASDLFGPRQLFSTRPESLKALLDSSSKRVVLIGDAAHATTTHRGMGANTALADASDLADVLASGGGLHGLAAFNKVMHARAVKIVDESLASTNMIHATGWFAHVRNPILASVGKVLRLLGK